MNNVNITLPVYNEERILEDSVKKIIAKIKNEKRYNYEIVIVDNGSTDKTLEKAKKLSKKYNFVKVIHLNQKGRGRALKKVWLDSKANIFSYMDIDLSTKLKALPKLIDAIAKGGYDIAIGSRRMKESKVDRSLKREVLSRGYNTLLQALLSVKFSDAQCGFKSIRKDVAEKLIPQIKDNDWFFDTELLVIAEKKGYKIREIPVVWTGSSSSKVKILRTIREYIIKVSKLRLG